MEALLDKFDLTNANPACNPFPANFRPIPATNAEHALAPTNHIRKWPVQNCMLPQSQDLISHTMLVYWQDISTNGTEHYRAAKHLLRYIWGTSNLCLTSDADAGKWIVLGYADADWGGDLDTRRSTTGYVFVTILSSAIQPIGPITQATILALTWVGGIRYC
jgi:hypothetical protein